MLRSMNEQIRYRIQAKDGPLGHLDDFLLDDRTWMVRYAVVDTGEWLPGRQVLMPLAAIQSVDGESQTVHLTATQADIESAPDLQTDEPVSRQYEHYLHEHYRWQPYWVPGFAGSMVAPIVAQELTKGDQERLERAVEEGDPHLRSLRELIGYTIQVDGKSAGKVADFMGHDDSWEVPFLIADVGGWFHKELLMVPVTYVRNISFADHQLTLALSAESLEHLPEFDPKQTETGQLEVCVYDYRGRLVSHEPVEK